MGASNWTQEEIDYVIDNYYKLTAKAIAEHLGRTKNMVIGKAKRLGLKDKAPPIKPYTPKPLPEQEEVKQGVTIEDIKDNQCRYYNDGLFCGAKTEYKHYCMAHAKVVYQTNDKGEIIVSKPKAGTRKDKFGKVYDD